MTVPPAAEVSSPPPSIPPPSRLHRWKRRAIIVVVLLTLCWVCRGPLLRAAPTLLITREDVSHSQQILIVVDGAESYDEVSRRIAQNPSAKIWLFDRVPNRLQRRGLLPPTRECSQLACETAGIHAERIEVQPEMISGTRGLLDEVDRRLTETPTVSVGLIINEWNSRWLAGQVWSRMSSASRRRVQVIPVSDGIIDRSTWWHTKPGRRRFTEAALKLAADWIVRDSPLPSAEISDEELRHAGVGQP